MSAPALRSSPDHVPQGNGTSRQAQATPRRSRETAAARRRAHVPRGVRDPPEEEEDEEEPPPPRPEGASRVTPRPLPPRGSPRYLRPGGERPFPAGCRYPSLRSDTLPVPRYRGSARPRCDPPRLLYLSALPPQLHHVLAVY
ncbi:psoriasis susceptibility 1 candidate gene 2 protein homolog [Strigops habroptila]|uniref:psoriasis susceptibility 1 candidate gene 2 protein homolog n=1 Tax=Strigops habroptila TaxID=2489341 RepID=UPI0011CF2DB0|nr:psoriasis susceptibility 1 candidate gene 2 protein homolog [Strigops habroptila]